MPFRILEHLFWPIFFYAHKKVRSIFPIFGVPIFGQRFIVYDCLCQFSRFIPIEMFARQVSMPIKIFARSADFVEFLCLDARFA